MKLQIELFNKCLHLFLRCVHNWNINAFVEGFLLSQQSWLHLTKGASANTSTLLKILSELPSLSLFAPPRGQNLTLTEHYASGEHESEVGNIRNAFSLDICDQMQKTLYPFHLTLYVLFHYRHLWAGNHSLSSSLTVVLWQDCDEIAG